MVTRMLNVLRCMASYLFLVRLYRLKCARHVLIDIFITVMNRERFNMKRKCERSDQQSALLAKNSNHLWLANRQDLAVPILPPTSKQAKQILHAWLVEENFSNSSIKSFVARFNLKADGADFFYLVPELVDRLVSSFKDVKRLDESEDAIQTVLDQMDHEMEEAWQSNSFSIAPIQDLIMSAPTSGQLQVPPRPLSSRAANGQATAVAFSAIPLALDATSARTAAPFAASATSQNEPSTGPIRKRKPRSCKHCPDAHCPGKKQKELCATWRAEQRRLAEIGGARS